MTINGIILICILTTCPYIFTSIKDLIFKLKANYFYCWGWGCNLLWFFWVACLEKKKALFMIEDYTTTLFGYTPNKVVSRMKHLAACSILFPNLGNSQTELLCLHSSTVLFCLEVIKAQFPQFPLKGISRVVVHVATLPPCLYVF